jgi:hypothetical protein
MWLHEEGCAGVLVVIILVSIMFYIAAIFLLHVTSLVDELIEEPDSLQYLGVTPGVQVVVAVVCLALSLRCIRQLKQVTCGITRLQDKIVGRYQGTIRSKWRIRRAYYWQRSWLGVSGK